MKRYFAAIYRGRWLYALVLLILVGGSAGGTYVLSRSKYEATALIWVDKPPLDSILDQNNPPVAGYTPPPAQLQADKLYQLAQTDSFMMTAIKGTSVGDQLTGDPDQDHRLLAQVRKKLAVGMLGPNTMSITYTCTEPVLCQQIVQNTIDGYRTWQLQAQIEQNSIEVLFYQSQLKNYQDQLDAANKRLEDYQAANPQPQPASNQYLELQRLQDEVKSAQSLYSATKSRIDEASIVQNLSDKSGRSEFQVLDKPALPQRPSASLSKLIKYFGIGTVASIGLVVAAVVFSVWQDTSVRTVEDLGRLTNIPVLEVIPTIKQPKKRRKPRGDEPQRASGLAPAATGQGAD